MGTRDEIYENSGALKEIKKCFNSNILNFDKNKFDNYNMKYDEETMFFEATSSIDNSNISHNLIEMVFNLRKLLHNVIKKFNPIDKTKR